MEVVDIELENKEILRKFRKLFKYVQPILKDDDALKIKQAFKMSAEAHKDMRRKSGEPYIYHPIAVAQIAAEELGLGTTSIIAALLHDVVEDTDVELQDIEKIFGPKVAKIIDGLTKISGVFQYGTSQQAENFRKMLLTLTDDVRVILIKLADRLHNMRTLDSMPRNTQLKIASETIYLYAPMAHRLGLYAFKSELEDLYLKYAEPDTYHGIANKIKQTKASRAKFIKDFISPIQNELKKSDIDTTIKGRPKSIYSIWNKIKKNGVAFEEIYDLFAIRVIINTEPENEKAACWQAYSVVTDFYKPNPDRLRDWISTPKSNGYESLHTTVMSKSGQWVEVQIRTQRMDEIAEKGYAAHWKYKENSNNTREHGLETWLNKVRDTLSKNDNNAIEFVNDFRNNLFSGEVYVYTPKGDLKVLQKGATALDFAFDIHTAVGVKCLGAKVNSKLVPLSYKLNNGDQVEILTGSKQKPNEDWLNFVVTSRAKTKIRDYLKEDRKRIAAEGKEILDRKAKNLKLDLSEESLTQARIYFELKTLHEFYFKIGNGTLKPTDLRKYKDWKDLRENAASNIKSTKDNILDTKSFEKEIKKIKGSETADILLIGEDMDKIDYTLAKCCNPISGDDVFGFVTINDGIKIHRTTCPNAAELMSQYGYRIIKAKWTSQKDLAFLVGLRLTGADRVGIVNDVTRIISSELMVNMRSITIETVDGVFDGSIMLYVHDTSHLESLIAKLKKVSGIVSLFRFDTGS